MKLQNTKLRDHLASQYVLGASSSRVRRRFEVYLQKDPSLQVLVAQWSQRFNILGGFLKPVRPPKQIWKGIAHRLQLRTQRGLWHNLNVWRGLSAATTAALAIALYLSPLVQPPTVVESAPQYVAVVQNQQQQGAWLVAYEPDKNQLRVQNLNKQTLAADKDFELWLIPAEQQAPISLGLIKATADLQITLPTALRTALTSAVAVAVSLEPQGGSPTGAPTGPVLYQGKLTLL